MDNIINQLTIEELAGQFMHHSMAIPRFKIREYNYWNEGLHGVARAGKATVFPQAIALAASFQPSLIKAMATVIGIEARVKFNLACRFSTHIPIYQGLHLWSPVLNLWRDPRWGRGQETYGEDPWLIATLGAAFVKGLQKKLDGFYPLADATIKHAFVHSGPEHQRQQFNAIVSDHDLQTTYLPAFKWVVKKAKPAGLMMAYNAVNGKPCVINHSFIHHLVRKKWGFEGYIVADCQAVESLHTQHRVTNNFEASVLASLHAGIDLTCGNNQAAIQNLLKTKTLSIEDLKPSLNRLWGSRKRLGIDEDQPPYAHLTYEYLECRQHQNLNKRLAESSVILLKNDGLLPLRSSINRLAVVGNNADNVNALFGNYHGRSDTALTPLKAFQKLLKHTEIRYAPGCVADPTISSWLEQPLNEAKAIMDWAEVIILIVGLDSRYEGEENDANLSSAHGDRLHLQLSPSQLALIAAAKATKKPLVLVNISGGPTQLPIDSVNAAIQQFYGGSQGGLALARILIGLTNPSGKLPITIPDNQVALPSFTNYEIHHRTYRGLKVLPRFSFGYGLQYGRCQILDVKRDKQTVIISVIGDGKYDSQPVIQVYEDNLDFHGLQRQLVGYRKVRLPANATRQWRIPLHRMVTHANRGTSLVVSLNGANDKEAIRIG